MSKVAILTPQPLQAQAQVVTPADMISRAVESGANIEVLTKLMDLQERFEKNNARKAFDAAIASAKAEIPVIVKNKTGHNNKRYADMAALAHVVDPILSKHGLSYRFRSEQTDRISVTCVMSHKDGHSESNTLSAGADTSGNKNAIQALGSTLTYLQRYSLTQALGLAASEDDDGKASGTGNVITDEQADTIRNKLQAVGGNIERFLQQFGVECIPDIPAKDYARAISLLDAKARSQKGNANG